MGFSLTHTLTRARSCSLLCAPSRSLSLSNSRSRSRTLCRNLLLPAVLWACSTVATGAGVPALENTNWQLVEMTVLGGYKFNPAEPGKFVLNFRSDNRLTGTSDCNEVGGSWFQEGASLRFDPLGVTRKLCAPGSLHNNFALVLRDVQAIEVVGEHLLLKTSTEGVMLEFEAR